ncbi:hypothetical protein L0F63_007373 [Massospora cicadina]|nr:hypothetical protein L0F63_007373 [Massospora cicadina]
MLGHAGCYIPHLAKDLGFPPHRVSVAPMVDISTPHFIYLLRLLGGPRPQLYTEMFHSNAIINHNEMGDLGWRLGLDSGLAKIKSRIRPVSAAATTAGDAQLIQKRLESGFDCENTVVQLGGSDPKLLASATSILAPLKRFCAINLNLGCPSPAVQAGSFGAALMKDIDKVVDCVQAMESAAGSVPITVKCRLGVDDLDSEEFILDFVDKLSSKTRVAHFIIHARKCLLKGLSPAKNRTIPPLHYDRVYLLAKSFPELTFTLNGGIQTLEEARSHLDAGISNLEGIMLGRKISYYDCVKDNPAFLSELVKEFLSPEFAPPSLETIYEGYVEYTLALLAQGHRPAFILRPLMNLFPGGRGKRFRSRLQVTPLLRDFKPETALSLDTDGPRTRMELMALIKNLD